MRKIEEYRRRAEDCRKLAASVTDEDAKQQLLQMADTWDNLARNREEQLARGKHSAKFEQGN
jgi:hypothetical protein